jgi:hypothetical protein
MHVTFSRLCSFNFNAEAHSGCRRGILIYEKRVLPLLMFRKCFESRNDFIEAPCYIGIALLAFKLFGCGKIAAWLLPVVEHDSTTAPSDDIEPAIIHVHIWNAKKI